MCAHKYIFISTDLPYFYDSLGRYPVYSIMWEIKTLSTYLKRLSCIDSTFRLYNLLCVILNCKLFTFNKVKTFFSLLWLTTLPHTPSKTVLNLLWNVWPGHLQIVCFNWSYTLTAEISKIEDGLNWHNAINESDTQQNRWRDSSECLCY